jgi:hypothetical protein
MADVQPFCAVRYTGAAGPLAALVAPPYDVVSDEDRERLFTRSPYNVIHLTLPDSESTLSSTIRLLFLTYRSILSFADRCPDAISHKPLSQLDVNLSSFLKSTKLFSVTMKL